MKIQGNTVGTPMPRTDFNQVNPAKADYLKGRDDLLQLIQDAHTAGNIAGTAAGDAQTAADNAQTAANKAQTAADNAQTAADNAMTAAGNAQTMAENAEANAKEYADSRHINGEITLTPGGWSNNTQTVSFPGVTSDISLTDVYASPRPDDENYAAYTENGVRLYAQGENTLTFKCEDVPGVNVYVNVSVEFVGSYVPSGGDLPAWEGGSY